VEIRAQAYAFCTTDTAVSNTTFYSYQIINRANLIIHNSYIGNWTDVEIGDYTDDYVGCDVSRGMGFGYNGDADDSGAAGYGLFPPAVGIDILSGPFADTSDGIDNDFNGIIDESLETIRMSGFLYYNNDFTDIGNPVSASHYYNYLRGIWKNNSPMDFGGDGFQTGGDPCSFMFPGNSDPLNFGTHGLPQPFAWTEENPCIGCAANNPGDRRFLMSTGQFTMYPGQVLHITKAAIWSRDSSGVTTSLDKLRTDDDEIQNFYDSNFNSVSTCALTSGINDPSILSMNVYPSPSASVVYFSGNIEPGKIVIKIFDGIGKLVYDRTLNNERNFYVDVSEWSDGVYYYKLSMGKKDSASGKLTVMH
jgi:hypothetical protein